MQGGTLQEQFCQTRYPHGVQRRSFIHPVISKHEDVALKLHPADPISFSAILAEKS